MANDEPVAAGSGAAPPLSSELAVPDTLADVISAREAVALWRPKLAVERKVWEGRLASEAEDEWPRALVYIRLSRPTSLTGEAPDTYLRQTLALMAQRKYFVPEEAVHFEVETGTDVAPRGAFKRLYEAAMSGGYQAIGVAVSERLFRNVEQASSFKRQFRLKGIELIYMGMYEGDQRHPAAWQLQTMQDITAEMHARTTSFNVGTHLEELSKRGRPIGAPPEVWESGPRSPSIFGQRGSVQSWSLVEPLATILKQGLRRYLDGDTFSDLARWSATTPLKGVTPKRHVMSSRWWFKTLTNPKHAGYHWPTQYMGYKPGKESKLRPRKRLDEDLVPCMLPALWALEDYLAVKRIARDRWTAPKNRKRYHAYLSSSVIYSALCGHRLTISWRLDDGRFWGRCTKIGVGESRCGPAIRVDVVEQELEALIGSISLTGGGLRELIEEELLEISRREGLERARFRADPAIGSIRQALAALEAAKVTEGRPELERKLRALEAADAIRRERLSLPLTTFRDAARQLDDWANIWASADTRTKNRLLREAGLRVEVGRHPGQEDGTPAHVLRLSSENAAFALALAAVLTPAQALVPQPPGCGPNAQIEIKLDGEGLDRLGRLAGRSPRADGWYVRLPDVRPVPRKQRTFVPPRPDADWLTIAEAAKELGWTKVKLFKRIRKSSVAATLAGPVNKQWYFVRRDEVDRLREQSRGRVRHAVAA